MKLKRKTFRLEGKDGSGAIPEEMKSDDSRPKSWNDLNQPVALYDQTSAAPRLEASGFVRRNGAAQTHTLRSTAKITAPKKSRKRRRPPRKMCRNLRMCGRARVPKVTRNPHKLDVIERIEIDATGAAAAVRRVYEAVRLARQLRIRSYRKNLPDLLEEHALAMVKSAGGRRFFSSRGVGTWLVKRRLHEPVLYYTGFGNALGMEGLALPSFRFEGVRFFDLGCANMSEKQKAKRQAQIALIGVDLRPALIAG